MAPAIRTLRSSIVATVLLIGALGGAAPARAGDRLVDPSILVPPAPAPYVCRATGGGIRCDYNVVFEVDPFATGLFCGNGSNAFEIQDGGESIRTIAVRDYDDQGRILRRTVHETYLGASWMNPATGAAIPYTQSNTIHTSYAVPGDLTSVTESTSGNAAIFHVPGEGAIVRNAGRTTWVFDPEIGDLVLVSASGPQAFVRLFVDGDPSVLQPLCDVLAG